jgi:hypothetical protein
VPAGRYMLGRRRCGRISSQQRTNMFGSVAEAMKLGLAGVDCLSGMDVLESGVTAGLVELGKQHTDAEPRE